MRYPMDAAANEWMGRPGSLATALPAIDVANDERTYARAPMPVKRANGSQWNLCRAFLKPIIAKKSELVSNATWYFAWAAVSLIVPLLVAIAERMLN